ncbi:TetR/AcrR family transcriptional regulator [Neolewinella sp.]|uniref:TetR/AcrR family transcriptional regulator n=1 Tax=Neolewinella sp. TaxID=2993543 RepID=UPI003B52354A
MEPSTTTSAANDILAAARTLFQERGSTEVSVADVCALAGVSERLFYQYFEDTAAVGRLILQQFLDTGLRRYQTLLEQAKPLTERLYDIMNWKATYTRQLSDEFLDELFQATDPLIREVLDQHRKQRQAILSHHLYRGIGKGELSDSLNVPFILYMMDEVSELMSQEASIAMFPDANERMRILTEFLFFGIVGPRR